ncbi:hypothetical protein VPH35_117434 [Triticum aestivum]
MAQNTALLIGFVLTVIILKLALSTGIIPTLNVSAALLAFLALRGWTHVLGRLGVPSRAFTRQENTVVQTCAVACYTMGFGGGFGSSLLALNKKTYELAGVSTPGNAPGSYKEPGFGWMAGFLLAISFVGLLNLLPLRKALVIDYKLTYPSGTATAVLINGFHTPQGEKNAKMQVRGFVRSFVISLLWSFFQWFYTAWGGKDDGVIAGLVGCAIVKQLVQVSADLMHDYKTGHLTLTSPRSLLVGQAIGTVMGCIVAPSTFLLFYKAFDIGNPDGYWKAPYALIYRNMAILGVEGFSALPKRCLELSVACFAFSVLVNLVRDFSPQKYRNYVPLPMAMAVPFLVGANFAIDMCVGSLVVLAWHKMSRKEATLLMPAVASGFICGDGIWMFPSSLLSLAKLNQEVCKGNEIAYFVKIYPSEASPSWAMAMVG